MNPLLDPKFIIAYTIVVGFAAAYVHNPSDTMTGALIAAFAGAWGYYLGSSSSNSETRSQVGQALDLAATAAASTSPGAGGINDPQRPAGTAADPVHTTDEGKTDA